MRERQSIWLGGVVTLSAAVLAACSKELPPTKPVTVSPTNSPVPTETISPRLTFTQLASSLTPTLTPTETPTPEVSPDAFDICPLNQWQNCEVPLNDDVIDPAYYAWLETIPVEFPEGTVNKPLKFVGDDPILDPDTTKFNLTAGHALTSAEQFKRPGLFINRGDDELIYPVAIWSDTLQKPVWVVVVYGYVNDTQTETFLRGEMVPFLEKAGKNPNVDIAVQCNYLEDQYLDPLINTFIENHPDIDIQEAKQKFAETGDPVHLPKNTVFYLRLSIRR